MKLNDWPNLSFVRVKNVCMKLQETLGDSKRLKKTLRDSNRLKRLKEIKIRLKQN